MASFPGAGGLRWWQGVLGSLHYAAALSLAMYAEIEDKDWKTHVYQRYNAWVGSEEGSCGEGDGCLVYVVESRIGGYQVSLIWASAAFSLISGTHHLFAWRYWLWYKRACIDSGLNWVRWLDYGE